MAPADEGDGRLAAVRPLRPPRRAPWRQWPITVVLTVLALSLAFVALDHFRRGSVLLSASVLMAFFLRLLLPEREAGLLAVRGRAVDLTVLGALALSLSMFSLWVPSPT